jgi:MFS transporter, PAT family, beta-lactamase induction signal transducer AmpG
MTTPRAFRYALFALLYFAQGAIMSYFTALNAIYLLSFNVSLTLIGLMGTIALIPFVLKIFMGMLSDRVNLFRLGHRKPYIIIGLLIQAGCLVLVPAINPGKNFALFAMLGFLLMSGMALYDTCTDGLALDTTSKEEEGTVQGFMVGGRALGVVVLSAVIGLIAQNSSWTAMFYTLAILSLVPLVLVLRVKEAPRPVDRKFEWKAFKAFGQKSIIALGILGALYSLIINGANQLVNPFLQSEFHASVATAGFVATAWGIGVVLGGLSGGRLVDRIGQKRAVWLALTLAGASILALSGIFSLWMAWPLVILFGLAFGYYETVYFSIAMGATDLRIAASMFSILMALANVGTGVGLGLSGALADSSLGFRYTFIIIAALNLLAVPLLPLIFPRSRVQIAQEV